MSVFQADLSCVAQGRSSTSQGSSRAAAKHGQRLCQEAVGDQPGADEKVHRHHRRRQRTSASLSHVGLPPCRLRARRVRTQALYIAYRVAYLWSTFSGWHIAGYSILLLVYAVCYFMLSRAAAPTYKPLNEGGALVSGGSDLSQGGVIEYTWDMLYTTIFVHLTTGFISDLFWLLYLLPPCIGFYFLWTQVIYPWIRCAAHGRCARARAGSNAGALPLSRALSLSAHAPHLSARSLPLPLLLRLQRV
jgi:hypothetical protein